MKTLFIFFIHSRVDVHLLTRCFTLVLLSAVSISSALAQSTNESDPRKVHAGLANQVKIGITPSDNLPANDLSVHASAKLKLPIEKQREANKQNVQLKLFERQHPLEIAVGVFNPTNRKALLTLMDEAHNVIYERRVQAGWSLKIYNLRELPLGRYTLILLSDKSQLSRSFVINTLAKPRTQIVF